MCLIGAGDLCVCALPCAELLDAVKASIRIVPGDVGHAEGERPDVSSVLRARDRDPLQGE